MNSLKKNTYQYSYHQSTPRNGLPNKKSHGFLSTIIIVAIFLAGVGLFYRHIDQANKAKQLAATVKHEAEIYQYLNKKINSIMSSNPNISFGVSVINLQTNIQHNFGEAGPMTSASVSKILTAVDYFRQVEKGTAKLSATLEDGNRAGYDLQQMIVNSDDSSWEALNDHLSYNQIQSYATALDIGSYGSQFNTLSTSDMATLMAKLYEGKILDSVNTQQVLSYMEKANYRDLIVPAVPAKDTVYHKAGEINDVVNDSAIITNAKDAVAITIFTNGNGVYDWPSRASLMQRITSSTLEQYGLN